MDDLTAFITARLDEDEAIAIAAANRHWLTDDNIITLHPAHDDDGFMSWPTRADAQHAANHDPARVLREVAAKRAIVAMYEDQADRSLPAGVHDGRDDDERDCDEAMKCALGEALEHIAAVWSDRPDYKQEWAP